jgi:hypothetical protein
LNGDIDGIAADIGLAKRRAIAVDAIVADGRKSESGHGILLFRQQGRECRSSRDRASSLGVYAQ